MKNFFGGFGLALLSSLIMVGIGYLIPIDLGAKTGSDVDIVLFIALLILIPAINFTLAFGLKRKYSRQFFRGVLTVACIEIPLFLAGSFLIILICFSK